MRPPSTCSPAIRSWCRRQAMAPRSERRTGWDTTMSRALMVMLIVGAMCGRVQAQTMPADVEDVRAAGWTFTPGASLGGAWDSGINTASNPFVENVFQRWVGLVNPWADLNFNGRRGRFNAGYSGAFEKYWDSDLNWQQ